MVNNTSYGAGDEERKRNQRLKIKEQNDRAKFKMKIRKTRIVGPNRRKQRARGM